MPIAHKGSLCSSAICLNFGELRIMNMALIRGRMGERDAAYHLASDLVNQEGHRPRTGVWLTDAMGMINDGHGFASFNPAWIFPEQRRLLERDYQGSVERSLLSFS